ncbi:MAG: tetratricopeptide repeat protein [Myxococcales bacterium]|nr:tetratricopeptide repeat protein [Myxococcales bacterium]
MKSLHRVFTFALAAALAGAPATSLAQKKGKKAAPKVESKPAPTAAKPEEPKKKKKEEERKGSFQLKQEYKLEDAEREAIADKKRDETIESLRKIIPRFQDGSNEKAELWFQLAELYWEKSKYLYRREMFRFQEEEKKVDAARNRGEKIADAKEDHRESESYRAQAMTLYEQILREAPAYERKDEVLFSLGYNLYETNKREQAVKRYEELIKNYPGSKFIADTYVQLGNHYFDVAGNLPKAKDMFERAFGSNQPRIKSYALYKLAWCDFNAGEHERALKKLQDVVDYTERQSEKKQFTDLKNEALNDMIRMWVQLNRAQDAVAYYKAHAGKKAQARLIARLADGLAEAGHHDNAIKTYQYLLGENPMQPKAPEFQQAVINSYEGLRQREMVKAEVKKLATLYRPGSEWWKANESKKEVLRDAFNVSEEAMRKVVTDYHQEAQKTKQVETYRLARDIYKEYVDAFATSEEEQFVSDSAFNMKFYYAEILWALEEWEHAAREYQSVVAFKVPNRDTAKEVTQEKYRQSAAYNAILTYDKLVKIERGLLAKADIKAGQKVEETKKKGVVEKQKKIEKRSPKDLVEQPISKFEQKLAEACDKYNELYPNNQDEIEVRYMAAVVYYDRNHFVEAAKRLGEVILKWPEEKRSQDAADISMSVLEEKEEWLEINKLSRQFLANKKLSKPGTEFTKRVGTIVENSQYKWVDEVIYKKEKNPARAAEEFQKFVAEFPKSDNADRALTHAMLIFREADQLDRGVEAGERVLKEYPGSVFELKARYSLARFYEKLADFTRSAEMYEAFIAAYDQAAGPKAVGYENMKELLKKEAKEAKGKPAKAVAQKAKAGKAAETKKVDPKEREDLIKEACAKPDDCWVADAQFNAALWWEGLGKSEKAISAYHRYMARFKERKDVPAIAFHLGDIQEKDKKLPEAIKGYEAYLTTYGKDSRVTAVSLYEARYRQFKAHRALKNQAESEKLMKELIAAYAKLSAEDKKKDGPMNGFGHARFLSLEPMWKQYLEIKFGKVATLKKDLEAKLKKIQEVEKAYTEVLAIGAGEWGIAALTRIGTAYADFAQNFIDSPNPKGLDEEQLEMYRGALEEKAFPLEEKSIEALEKALAKSYELAIYNEWTLQAQDKLNKYRPGTYGKVREVPFRGSEFFFQESVAKEAAFAEKSPPAGTGAGAH